MLTMATPAFGSAYELWREDTLLRLVFGEGAVIGTTEVKELLRLAFALDPEGRCAVLVECPKQLIIGQEARALVCRVIPGSLPAMACLTADLECRLQGELFRRLQRPRFPFRVFGWREEAQRWLRERLQLVMLVGGG